MRAQRGTMASTLSHLVTESSAYNYARYSLLEFSLPFVARAGEDALYLNAPKLLDPHARLRVVADPTAPLDLARYTDVFVYRPPADYARTLERQVTLGEVARYGALFRATPR